VTDPDTVFELAAFAALSLGLVFSSTCRDKCVEAISEVTAFSAFSPPAARPRLSWSDRRPI